MSEVLTVGSLFAGIGGFDLGLERAGMRTLWFCEQDPFCRRVLARHWPGVPCHPDVRALVADAERDGLAMAGTDAAGTLARRRAPCVELASCGSEDGMVPVPVPYVDVLCGGFPCQDISLAGRGAGLAGERSGLWREFARLISDLRPRYVIVENVPALTSRGLDVVLGDLAACGFDAEWDHLPASAFGAPHRRDRIWLVAYPASTERGAAQLQALGAATGRAAEPRELVGSVPRDGHVANASEPGLEGTGLPGRSPNGRAVADAEGSGRERSRRTGKTDGGPAPQLAGRDRPLRRQWLAQSDLGGMAARVSPWLDEPDVGRVAVGVPQRVDRLRALGNALVPQIAEWIGRQIIAWESAPLSPGR